MMQLQITKERYGEIPCHIVHSLRENGNAVVFYHGWSSSAEAQLTRAAILAINGYTVFLPDAVHHGGRGPLTDYYAYEDYDIFWKTIFMNINEFSGLEKSVRASGCRQTFLMGHSMGGMSVLGIAAAYPSSIDGVISFNGSGDWELTHLFMQARFGIAMDREWNLYDEMQSLSPVNHLSELSAVPLLLINGEADTSVDPRAQAHFYDLLSKEKGMVERITYPGLGHFVTTNMMDDALAWLDEIRKNEND